MTFSGVRDARRVLGSYYQRLVERKMTGKTAIGHMCGKIAKILYMMLKKSKNMPYNTRTSNRYSLEFYL
ncbi:hypothetical protein BN2127_JRS1_03246 [Bacillus cereus]|nr:hypothetical protein BN2127_JRS1_03246 [Bacillus cereus]